MKDLYAPWRNPYSQHHLKEVDSKECVFCSIPEQNNDDHHFLLKRYTHCYVILNKYPYNAGHLLVIPFAHTSNLNELEKEARVELMEISNLCVTLLKSRLDAQGINMGMNIGPASGAGIPNHLHIHILPRWLGDTNFLPTLADTKVISFDLKEMFQLLKPTFN
jgi:ATP adenylyltransferase